MIKIAPCPKCGSQDVYRSEPVSAGGGYAPNYLPALGGFWTSAKFRLVLCRSCGLTRFFASAEACAKVANSDKWNHADSI